MKYAQFLLFLSFRSPLPSSSSNNARAHTHSSIRIHFISFLFLSLSLSVSLSVSLLFPRLLFKRRNSVPNCLLFFAVDVHIRARRHRRYDSIYLHTLNLIYSSRKQSKALSNRERRRTCLSDLPLSRCVNVSQSTLVKPVFKLVMPVGSCIVWNMVSSPMVKCRQTRPLAVVTTRSTPSSVKLVPANTCPVPFSSTWNPLSSVRVFRYATGSSSR